MLWLIILFCLEGLVLRFINKESDEWPLSFTFIMVIIIAILGGLMYLVHINYPYFTETRTEVWDMEISSFSDNGKYLKQEGDSYRYYSSIIARGETISKKQMEVNYTKEEIPHIKKYITVKQYEVIEHKTFNFLFAPFLKGNYTGKEYDVYEAFIPPNGIVIQ